MGLAIVGGAVLLLAMPASAQNSAARVSGEFERPFGFAYGQEQSSYDANSRDAHGNRIILDGRIMTGMDQSTLSTASASAGAGYGNGSASGRAIGNSATFITTQRNN